MLCVSSTSSAIEGVVGYPARATVLHLYVVFIIFVLETREIMMDRSEIDFQIMVFSNQHPDSWLSLDNTRNMSDDEALLALKRAAINLLP